MVPAAELSGALSAGIVAAVMVVAGLPAQSLIALFGSNIKDGNPFWVVSCVFLTSYKHRLLLFNSRVKLY